MDFDPARPPLLTADLPGIGGQIKTEPEDFQVEEIPAYPASGKGDFLYLWIEKRDMGAEYFVRQVARRLEIAPGDVGTAGMKDRRAVTRQMVSVPHAVEDRLAQLEGDGLRLLEVHRHENKLKPGHLHGNRFEIVLRGVEAEASVRLAPIVERLIREGVPNFYGSQRFGRDGETGRLGMNLLVQGAGGQPRAPFLRKLALSAAQSWLFNLYLARRLTEGLLRRVLAGDVMAKWPFGGLFVAEDVATEQARFEARETVTAGPMFGRKTFAARGEAVAREEEILREAGVTESQFHGFGKLLSGTRRHNLIYVEDLRSEMWADGVRLCFTLPAGSYATVLLREITKTTDDSGDEAGE